MNLHNIVRNAIGVINPFIAIDVLKSNGTFVEEDGSRTPMFLLYNIDGQVQAATEQEIAFVNNTAQTGLIRTVWVDKRYTAIVRSSQSGGDIMRFGGSDWLIVHVIETWPDWVHVIVVQQETSTMLVEPGMTLRSLSALPPLVYDYVNGVFSIPPSDPLTDGYMPKEAWTDFVDINYDGYSLRFNEQFVSTGLKDTLDKIIIIGYSAPTISFSASGSSTVREKGDTVASAPLSVNATKRSDIIQRVEFFRGATSIFVDDPSAHPDGGTTAYTDATPFDNNVTYSVEVTDTHPTTVSASSSYVFVYPYYYGVGAQALTAAQVAALTKDIRVATTSLTTTLTASAGEVFYFAYPTAYSALTSILDVNGFETLPDWTQRSGTITGLDGSPQSYRIYEFNNPVVAGDYVFTFKR